MNQEIFASNPPNDVCVHQSQDSPSIVNKLHEPFLNFYPNSELSFEEKSRIYCSLVSLVKAGYPFDNALLDKAVQFLKNLELECNANSFASKLVTDLVPSSHTSPSRFIDSIVILVLGITTTVDAYNHREIIFQKVVLPSSQFLTFLISNRYKLHGWLLDYFMSLLRSLLEFGPYHRPTLEFVLASPIAMAFSSSLSSIETDNRLHDTLETTNNSLRYWKNESPEVVQSGKRMMRALISEGLNVEAASRMTPTRFCGLSSDVGNAVIAGADDQILGWPPIVQKWFALLGWSLSTRLSLTVTPSTVLSPNNSLRP
ncbi:hypothetical protein BLNAU_2109 [Blattamonas nauphoetae]|uniref:Uncharacterized protein n=1 Tax=Blattamonas nauphoetae TaxID=2049346 RepID=A0ABQ9YH48_9EUKA|nr:hypothetical protein BLNAU_2109 [Blattamonas nauphoetae]